MEYDGINECQLSWCSGDEPLYGVPNYISPMTSRHFTSQNFALKSTWRWSGLGLVGEGHPKTPEKNVPLQNADTL